MIIQEVTSILFTQKQDFIVSMQAVSCCFIPVHRRAYLIHLLQIKSIKISLKWWWALIGSKHATEVLDAHYTSEVGKVIISVMLHTCKQACCGNRLVPPPTVPISIEGIVQLMYRSSLVGPLSSISVMQLELPIFCAAS